MYDNDDVKKMAEVFEGMLRKGKLQELTPMLEGIAPVAETRALKEGKYAGGAKNDKQLIAAARKYREAAREARKTVEFPHPGPTSYGYEFKPKPENRELARKMFPELAKKEDERKAEKDESTTYYAWQTMGLEESDWARKAKDAYAARDYPAFHYASMRGRLKELGQEAAKGLSKKAKHSPMSDEADNADIARSMGIRLSDQVRTWRPSKKNRNSR